MRCAIIADIHANLPAFKEVLADIERQGGVDEVWFLGDLVGYGPDPHECIELLRPLKPVGVAGNHDRASIGKADTVAMTPDAAAACIWTAGRLTPEDIEYLDGLPLSVVKGEFTLVHGSPRDPVWEYLRSTSVAMENFSFFEGKYCLTGHTHLPGVFRQEEGTCSFIQLSTSIKLVLGKGRLIICPGGVGQPRDGDPRAGYAIYDSDIGVIRLYRVAYDIEATRARMMEAGLPIRLIERLSLGK
ncbi:metallophosphoesterase family protein [Chloroflexota bacterium]